MVKTNLQPQGLMEEDISWVKVNLENWSSPDAALPPPAPQLYDAALLTPTSRDLHGAATRENVTCPACQQLRRKRKVKDRHTLVWGECLRAIPPPPAPVGHVPELAVDLLEPPEFDRPADVHEDAPEDTVRRCGESSKIDPDRLCSHPHASLALFDDEADPEVLQEANANVDELVLSGEWRVCASHFTQAEKDTVQKVLEPQPGRITVPTSEVSASIGDQRQRWISAAEAELANNFVKMGAMHESTAEERKAYG